MRTSNLSTAKDLYRNPLGHPYWKDCNPLNKRDECLITSYSERKKASEAFKRTKEKLADCIAKGGKVIYL